MGVIPTLGQAAFEQNMQQMNLEFPAIVYGHALKQTVDKTTTCQ